MKMIKSGFYQNLIWCYFSNNIIITFWFFISSIMAVSLCYKCYNCFVPCLIAQPAFPLLFITKPLAPVCRVFPVGFILHLKLAEFLDQCWRPKANKILIFNWEKTLSRKQMVCGMYMERLEKFNCFMVLLQSGKCFTLFTIFLLLHIVRLIQLNHTISST